MGGELLLEENTVKRNEKKSYIIRKVYMHNTTSPHNLNVDA